MNYIRLLTLLMCGALLTCSNSRQHGTGPNRRAVKQTDGRFMSLHDVLSHRRSVRHFSDRELTATQIKKLLFAGQGVTDPRGYRTTPSAGALYPLALYVVSVNGVFHYIPDGNEVRQVAKDDRRARLADAAFSQFSIANAPVSIVVFGVVSRTAKKYGDRAQRYVAMEAGACVENMLLQVTAMKLGAVWVGAFNDDAVKAMLTPGDSSVPYAIIPVGVPALEI